MRSTILLTYKSNPIILKIRHLFEAEKPTEDLHSALLLKRNPSFYFVIIINFKNKL